MFHEGFFFSFKVGHMPVKIEHDYSMHSQYPRLDNEMKPFRPDLGETVNDYHFFHMIILFVIYLETSLSSIVASLQLEQGCSSY